MPDREIIQRQIALLFSQKLNIEITSVDADLFEAGILDSLKFVELLVELEKLFATHVSLEDLEVDNFRSIQKIAEFVTGQNGGNKSA